MKTLVSDEIKKFRLSYQVRWDIGTWKSDTALVHSISYHFCLCDCHIAWLPVCVCERLTHFYTALNVYGLYSHCTTVLVVTFKAISSYC